MISISAPSRVIKLMGYNKNTLCDSPERFRDSVSVSCAVILGADHQTSTLLCSPVNGFNNVDELLLVLQHPVELVVVTSSEIAHHVLVAKEEQD
jgi:hypothetical protein